MNQYTDKQIEDTLNLIDSTILNCEKIQPKLKEGTPQISLTRNRIKALYISKALVTNQEHNYTQEELLKSVDQVTSIIRKSEKAMINAKEGTGTYTRLKKIIDAMTIALSYIEDAMNEFVLKTDALKKNIDEIAGSINTITAAVDEGAEGVNSTAENTQSLVEDIVNISSKMKENKAIAKTLQESTDIFAIF